MDIKQIRYFLCLCETLNFSRASQELGISQPTLSRSIQRLEAEVGLLIYRDGKDTRMTALAKALRPEFAAIDECERRARQISLGHSHAERCAITVGIANTYGPKRFDRFLLTLIDSIPDLHISTFEVSEADGPDALLKGNIDLLISGAIHPNPKLSSKELFCEPLMLAMGNTHPLAIKPKIEVSDLNPFPFVDLEKCKARANFLTWAREHGTRLDTNIVCHREDWVQRIVSEGEGVTLLSGSSLVTSELTLRPITNFHEQRSVQVHSIFGSPKAKVIDDAVAIATGFAWEIEPQGGGGLLDNPRALESAEKH